VLLPYSGTFSANPITMTAGRVAMELFDREAVRTLNALGEKARDQIRQAVALAGIPVSVTGIGSMFRIHLKAAAPVTYREAWPDKRTSKLVKLLIDHVYDQGIMLINTGSGALSTVMTQAEIDRLSEALLIAFKAIKPELEKARE
jgi:glutamate-1-semialdehyde 2,1-aminomutase